METLFRTGAGQLRESERGDDAGEFHTARGVHIRAECERWRPRNHLRRDDCECPNRFTDADADSNRYADTISNSDPNSFADTDAFSNAHTHSNANCHANADPNTYGNSNRYGNPDRNSNTEQHADFNAND